ncbi:hypothetical protein Poly21_53770 [Allorhodopirellula heiligendammensis]|uniref:Uncharacterized protein n=1 Tax=Allorhodopirellula heiligendammensis TaxID=2714739 RepID=A0A5C6BDM3_9BACT|nr:hypothetical protein Poly21_53770 [Allorhodopirellula heiligendammensis]
MFGHGGKQEAEAQEGEKWREGRCEIKTLKTPPSMIIENIVENVDFAERVNEHAQRIELAHDVAVSEQRYFRQHVQSIMDQHR